MRAVCAAHGVRFRSERVRAAARLGQRICGNLLGFAQQREVFGFVFFLAEVNDRQGADAAVAAVGNSERGHAREFLRDDHSGDFVEVFAAVLFRHRLPHHREEVRRKVEVVVGIHERHADAEAMARCRQRRHLGDQSDDLGLANLRREDVFCLTFFD